MSDHQRRRDRMRLARQSAAPSRIRRQRGEQRAGIPWVTIGTAAGAVAAIGSLIATAVATYYSAEVAKAQLDQSKKDTERDERDQATRVTFWEENSFYEQSRAIHLVNRSPDAVSNVQVFVDATVVKGEKDLLMLADSNLPPCSEIVYKAGELSGSIVNGEGEKKTRLLSDTAWEIKRLVFTDREGKIWSRAPVFLELETEVDSLNPLLKGIVVPKKQGKVKALDSCGSAS
ncbi:hypothetical protein ACWCPM_05680 [Streptomyces sp. NPDC002309]